MAPLLLRRFVLCNWTIGTITGYYIVQSYIVHPTSYIVHRTSYIVFCTSDNWHNHGLLHHCLQLLQPTIDCREIYPLNYDTFMNPNFQHTIRDETKNILKSSLSSFPCQLLLWMETHRKFIQTVANNHFSSF